MDCATDACCTLLGMENATSPDESPLVVEHKQIQKIVSGDDNEHGRNHNNMGDKKSTENKKSTKNEHPEDVVEVVTEEQDDDANKEGVEGPKDQERARICGEDKNSCVVVTPETATVDDPTHQPASLRGRGNSRTPSSSTDNSTASSTDSRGSHSSPQHELSLLELASAEIERIRQRTNQPTKNNQNEVYLFKFPAACLALCKSLAGNQRCVDCGARRPEWAAVSYGALLCLKCSGHHRSLGVQVSQVRSLAMDEFSLPQLLALLEGGNAQWTHFLERHHLTPRSWCKQQEKGGSDDATNNGKNGSHKSNNNNSLMTKHNVVQLRYKTKAAQFYRQQMTLHIARILQQKDHYRGRTLGSRRHSHRTLDQRNSTVE